jgi:hypothetical protein
MKVQISVIWVVLALATATVAGQSTQTATPSTTTAGSTANPTPSATSPTPSTTSPTPSTSEPTRQATELPALQLPPIGRSDPDVTATQARPDAQARCAGNAALPAAATSSSSSFPGISASQLPRAGVSADAFVRPGVSAAQLAMLLPGARNSPCAPPRDVILYPDTGTPSRRVPPPGENQPRGSAP